MMRSRRLATVTLALSLGWAASANADPVTYWNQVITTSVTEGRSGPPGLLDIALAHLAIHDAVQAIEGQFQPYHYDDPGQRGVGSTAAAVAAAAHRTLVLLYPGQQAGLDGTYNTYLSMNGLTDDPGLDVGEAAAEAVHAAHYRPVIAMDPFFGHDAIGAWRSAVPMAFLYLAFSEPFALNRVDQFRPPPPPPMNSVRYAREYDEVKRLGDASAHPNDTSEVARFWSVNFITQWNEAARQLADNHVTTIGDSARMFALANMAAADSAMAVWDSKYFYNFWRPSTAINEGNYDPNARTAGDPGWTPFVGNPAYPDYVSGANGLTGAFTGMLRLFFNTDTVAFSVKSTHALLVDPEREYTSFSQAAAEVVEARILLGIHFRSADEEARRLGERVAHWAFQKCLKPMTGRR